MSTEPAHRHRHRQNVSPLATLQNVKRMGMTQTTSTAKSGKTYRSPNNSPSKGSRSRDVSPTILKENQENRRATERRDASPTPLSQKFTFQTLQNLTRGSRNRQNEQENSIQVTRAKEKAYALAKQQQLSDHEFQQQLAHLEERSRDKMKRETLEMYKTSTENDQIVLKLRKELEEVKYRNLQLESFYAKKSKFEEILRERDELREKNLDLLNSALAYENLAEKLTSLQHKRQALEKGNAELTTQIESYEKTPITESEYVETCAKRLQLLRKELCQLVQLVNSIKNGEEVNLTLLLGGMYTYDDTAMMQGELDLFNRELQSLRNLASDIYSEVCGSKCLVQ